MKAQKSMTVIDDNQDMASVDFSTINVIEMKGEQVSIHANGTNVKLSSLINLNSFKYRLFCLEEIFSIGIENIPEELEEIYNLLLNPELYTEEELKKYDGMFFDSSEIHFYQRFRQRIESSKKEEMMKIFTQIESVDEKIKLESEMTSTEKSHPHKIIKM